jgi:hypothetical protein
MVFGHAAEKQVLGLDPGASFSEEQHAQLLGIDHLHAF